MWQFSKRSARFAYRKRKHISTGVLVFLLLLGLFSYFTNPFVRFTLTKDPSLVTTNPDGQFVLEEVNQIKLFNNRFIKALAQSKTVWHIVANRFVGGKETKSQTESEIIKEIHEVRFNEENPFLISGDHFSLLYPRSLGIFYHSLLDSRTALDAADWEKRQKIYLKSLDYALDVFAQSNRLATTIVPIAPKSVTLLNIYAPPSDTLYSLLYAIYTMQNKQTAQQLYPFETDAKYELQTQLMATQLLSHYNQSLKNHYATYIGFVVDPQTKLIKKDILLSSTKDIVKRQSSFYDNVILWKTKQLAQELGLTPKNPQELDELKTTILKTFWLPTEGYFLEDLSKDSIEQKYYSSDWLIAFMSGFLSVTNNQEKTYFIRSIDHIRESKIDEPFGLRFHNDQRLNRLYLAVRLVTPNYGGTAIWSNWGMEYIKLLLALYQVDCTLPYLEKAQQQLNQYKTNIETYRGYPEVYQSDGKIFQEPLYKSVIRTGWVVSYEQAQAMRKWSEENSCK